MEKSRATALRPPCLRHMDFCRLTNPYRLSHLPLCAPPSSFFLPPSSFLFRTFLVTPAHYGLYRRAYGSHHPSVPFTRLLRLASHFHLWRRTSCIAPLSLSILPAHTSRTVLQVLSFAFCAARNFTFCAAFSPFTIAGPMTAIRMRLDSHIRTSPPPPKCALLFANLSQTARGEGGFVWDCARAEGAH